MHPRFLFLLWSCTPLPEEADLVPPSNTEVAAGDYHSCALREGRIRCWGLGDTGRLGYGNTNTIGDDESPASTGDISLPQLATQITAGSAHTCALLEDQQVFCWGSSAFGQLGYANTQPIGDDETPESAGAVDVGGPVAEVSAGGSHTCALREDGAVLCWGFGGFGALGYGDTRNIGNDETPASAGPVDLGSIATHIEVGTSHACALLDDGSARCWGSNANGQLGQGNFDDIGNDEPASAATPIALGISSLSIGLYHSCAVDAESNGWCWGANESGELGYGNTEDIGDNELPETAGPLPIPDLAEISAGGIFWFDDAGIYFHGHTCARRLNGEAHCWGAGDRGQLGNGSTDPVGDNEPISDRTPILESTSDLSVGGFHTCVAQEGEVRCWGGNDVGQLGLGNTDHLGDDETVQSVDPVELWDE